MSEYWSKKALSESSKKCIYCIRQRTNWHHCDDGIPPTPSYSQNFICTINTSMRLHACNSQIIRIKDAPNPKHFSNKRGCRYTETANIYNDTKTYSITYTHENGKIIWNSSSRSGTYNSDL